MKHIIIFITAFCILYSFLGSVFPAIAATKAIISYDPTSPNFSVGSQNVITATIHPEKGKIAAVTVIIRTNGNAKLVKILDPQDENGTTLSSTKVIRDQVSDTYTKLTVLIMQANADLPVSIRLPIVIAGNKKGSGSVEIDTKKSQVIDENGTAYTLPASSISQVNFSDNGKDSVQPPSPTPLSADKVAVNVTMKFQGIIKPSDVVSKTMSGVKLQLVTGNTYSLPQYITVTMDDGGLWHGSAVFSNIHGGKNYALLIKGPKHLQKRICDNNARESASGAYRCSGGNIEISGNAISLNASGVDLMAGDVGSQDGIVNSFDLSYIANAIRKTSKTSFSETDINDDGKTDKTDFDLVFYTLTHTRGQDQL